MTNERDDMFDRLAAQARRLVAGRQLPDGELPWEAVQQVQADYRQWLEVTGTTQADVARRLGRGFDASRLSRFANAQEHQEIKGDADKLARAINQLIETDARRRRIAKPAGFVETNIARHILTVVGKAIEMQAIALIFGDSGRGKSISIQAAASIFPGSILVRVTTSNTTPRGILQLICEAAKCSNPNATAAEMLRKLVEKLQGTGRALLIDEAHSPDYSGLQKEPRTK